MGFLDTLLGRTKPVPPKLDDLFALPSAAITLEAGTGFKPTGSGSVCFRPVEGRSFSDVQKEVQELLDMDSGKEGGLPVEATKDSYGFTWLVSSHMSDQLDTLVTDLHAVNSSLVDAGFGPQLLCTLVAFRDDQERRLGLIYLYKRGTFYPFAPLNGERRDNALELQVKGVVGDDLKWEPDLSRLVPRLGRPRAVEDSGASGWNAPAPLIVGIARGDAHAAAMRHTNQAGAKVTVQQETTEGIVLTEGAAAKVSGLLAQEGRDDLRLRIAVQPGGCSGLRYQLYFDEREIDGDIVADFGGVQVVTDKMSAPYLMGATIDFVDTIEKQGFTIDNPNATGSCACGDSFH